MLRIKRDPYLRGILDAAEPDDLHCYICGAGLTEEDLGPECNDCLCDGFYDNDDPFNGNLWEKIDNDDDE